MSLQAKEFTFMGYGIDDSLYSDFKKEDVTGKLVLIFSGEPYDIFENSILTGTPEPSHWSSNWRKKLELMKKKGAAAVFIITEDVPAEIKMLKHYIETPSMYLDDANEEKEERTAPSFYISEKMELKKMKEKIDKKAKPLSFTSKTDVKIRLQRKTDNLTAENVLGLIEGTDLKDEYIIITAHYDHIGADGKEVYNGADDDGSGTVALLEIAEAFMKAKSEGNGPRRSVLIMPVSGEEKGLLGSKYYTDHPVFPLEKTVCDLNIDMIGRLDDKHKDNPNYVYLIGSDKLSSELHKISEEANDKYSNLQLDYTFNRPEDPNRFYYRSDHYNFAKNNIPVIFYFNGTHEDYHKPTDTVDKINFEKMEKITRLVFYTAWELANRNERIKVDAKNDFK
jgi:Zn-dependent M28 family amino/carboxypeptidase